MGQGYSMTTLSAAGATIDVPELADLSVDKVLASARLTKSIRARNPQGFVFVKAVIKPSADFNATTYVRQIVEERNALADIPNALGYRKLVEVSSGGFLIRQHIYSSVYDRLSTRPFLEDIEKKWLAFQLLCAVRDCHARNVYHGDIKTENLLVTSWNWLYLADFSSAFKPTTLPEDNPADFSFYFDTSARRTCYIAPERFTTSDTSAPPAELTWAMDMFSVGCTIAEIFLEGPIFSLSQIFKYRTGEYDPKHIHLSKIEDAEVQAMVSNMIELDPEKRYSAEQHLSFYKAKIFPEYFYSFLHQYMQDLTEPSSAQKPLSLEWATLHESDEKIDRIHYDFDKLSYFLGYGEDHNTLRRKKRSRGQTGEAKSGEDADHDTGLLDGTLLFLTMVASSLRNTTKASARLKACDLLVAFSERLPDEAKLDRVVPYIVGLLNDRSDIVKVAALHAMTSIFETVQVVSPINAYVFPEYVFPRLRNFTLEGDSQASALVRAAYASCLASLALASARILDMVQAIRADGRLPALADDAWAPEASFHGLYDVARAELVPFFEAATTSLITDEDSSVRRALLGSVSRLCIFFGSSKASDVILSHLNTYLNEHDWILRCAFYDALVGVALYVGASSLEKFILPVMVGSLIDTESFVVEKVFRSLSRIAAFGLLQKSITWELISIAGRFCIHPSIWVRESAVQFVVQSSTYLSVADNFCIILPILQPFLKTSITEISEVQILDNLKRPLSRAVYDGAVYWASRKEKSLFWTAASQDMVFTISEIDALRIPSTSAKRLQMKIPASQRDKDDQASLETLRNLGMTQEDEVKLMALREYILRQATRRADDNVNSRQDMLSEVVPLTKIEVTPQNVFFDTKDPVRCVQGKARSQSTRTRQEERHTLKEALLEASTALDNRPADKINSSQTSDGNSTSLSVSGPIAIGGQRASSATHLDLPSSQPKFHVDPPEGESRESPASDTVLSPRVAPWRRGSGLDLKHRGSAINLMSRKDTARADAETSTTSENAFGKLDGPLQRTSTPEPSALRLAAIRTKKSTKKGSTTPTIEPNHSYAGNDPNILRLLDHHFMENFPIDAHDFGEPIAPIETTLGIRRATDMSAPARPTAGAETISFSSEPWRPSGQLLTQFSEHTAGINRIVAAVDQAFFVTASDDGTCKIWDTTRLEKNVTPRSRYTHRHAPGTKVKAICFVEGTHTFVSAADDGSIHAVRVDIKPIDGGDTTRYGKPALVRDYMIPQPLRSKDADKPISPEHAVWLYHYKSATSQSVLLAATNKCRILAIDMKTMDIIHAMQNPIQYGTPTTFCVDQNHHWLLLGTSHGIVSHWDLRFKLLLRSFGIQSDARIDRIELHPVKGHGKWVMISSAGEISVWDIEKLICREVLRPSTFTPPTTPSPKTYESWSPDDEPSENLLSRFASAIKTDPTLLDPPLNPSPLSPSTKHPSNLTSKSLTHPITTLFILRDHLYSPSHPDHPTKASILFTAGSDRAIRYWDIPHPQANFIVSGPQLQTDTGLKPKIRYEVSHPLSLSLGGQIQLTQEILDDNNPSTKHPGSNTTTPTSTPKKRPALTANLSSTTNTTTRSSPSKTSSSPNKTTTSQGGSGNASSPSSKPPRNSIISTSQAQLLRTHMDGITDLIVLRRPYGCVVSVDRGGSIFVFH